MKNLKRTLLILSVLAAMQTTLAAQTASPQAMTNSAQSSPGSVTHAPAKKRVDATAACMAAAIDLEKTRQLAASLDAENAALRSRLETGERMNEVLTELNAARRDETQALRTALAAKDETVRAKDAALAAQDKLIAELKARRPSMLRRVGEIAIGAVAGAVLLR
jgi:hypothetical protein